MYKQLVMQLNAAFGPQDMLIVTYIRQSLPRTDHSMTAHHMQALDQAGFAASLDQVMQSPTRCQHPTVLCPSTFRAPVLPRGQA